MLLVNSAFIFQTFGNHIKHGRRYLFNMPSTNRTMKYAEKRLIGFSADQMFDVVNTVADYPQFVPYCKKADVRKISDHVVVAELKIGFPPIHEEYKSKVTSLRPFVVRSVCTDGRLFKVLDTTWRFHPAEGRPNCCILYYSIDFEFKSAFYAKFAHMFFDQIVRTMVSAFLKRAEKVYGTPAVGYDEMKPEMHEWNRGSHTSKKTILM
uniref:Coenzyme Q-binding protein COQ10 START domain-containing protein n=1 Tax=Panagrolaimus sp. JU765 TaxID=591449 RepID=A0AC34Q597_9BILA